MNDLNGITEGKIRISKYMGRVNFERERNPGESWEQRPNDTFRSKTDPAYEGGKL